MVDLMPQTSLRISDNIISPRSIDDPIFPWLQSIKKGTDDFKQNPDLGAHLLKLLEDCIKNFENESRYRNDIRFLKVWILYADAIHDFEAVFRRMEEKNIFLTHSLLYEAYAAFLVSKRKLVAAHCVYQNAEPLEELKKKHSLFLNGMLDIVNACSKIESGKSVHLGRSSINPWLKSTIEDLLKKIHPHISKYKGYCGSAKVYSGKVPLSSLKSSSRNKVIELGGKKYQIKGCSGQGGFAEVFKAYVDSNPDDVVALKIQRPAFPWEFYMYRLLDERISDVERPSFGFAHKAHIYSDCSVLVCDYIAHGTLQDVVNSYLVTAHNMDEVLCIYYTIEMLRMLETLHNASIIHGDFKPDNLLVRYASGDLLEDGFRSRTGPWCDQGLCLVDWGKGIDLRLFPDGTVFTGDCRTSGFRCVEMQENRTWTFQVDTYGLCVIVHMMLHGKYMEIEKKAAPDGSYLYQPKSSLKRYWNVDLWNTLFAKLLNVGSSGSDVMLLQSLRKSFEDYICGSPHLIRKLKELLVKQRASLCSS
ncbi:protein kinase and Mad3-BUB1-I domain-containing protein isoform X2 [Tasmannia lanceolata]|uniref:protein kinase and Mad3-BUB1-I domain-containing protein isoform X2 n=1 Tax=Tasmannia lanceolata TaxID=3420 RepID=UPI0040632B77